MKVHTFKETLELTLLTMLGWFLMGHVEYRLQTEWYPCQIEDTVLVFGTSVFLVLIEGWILFVWKKNVPVLPAVLAYVVGLREIGWTGSPPPVIYPSYIVLFLYDLWEIYKSFASARVGTLLLTVVVQVTASLALGLAVYSAKSHLQDFYSPARVAVMLIPAIHVQARQALGKKGIYLSNLIFALSFGMGLKDWYNSGIPMNAEVLAYFVLLADDFLRFIAGIPEGER